MSEIQLEFGEKEELFYMQDARQYVGNSVLFWAKECNGYTCDIGKAHVFTREDLNSRVWRKTDHAWPKKYMDSMVVAHVDAQYIAPAFQVRIPREYPLVKEPTT